MPAPTTLPRCSVLLLAGGRGQRMGGADKGLLDWQGRPLIAWLHELVRRSKPWLRFGISPFGIGKPALHAMLAKALPKQPLIYFTSASADEQALARETELFQALLADVLACTESLLAACVSHFGWNHKNYRMLISLYSCIKV